MKKTILHIILLLSISTLIFLSGCLEQLSGTITNQDVYLMSQKFVKEQLVSPASAQFPSINNAKIIKKNMNTWLVVSYVDSQNRFGAMLRNYYACTLAENNGEWLLIDLNIGENDNEVLYNWYFVNSFSSYEGKTPTFTINGDRWRIEWNVGGREKYGYGYDIFDFSIWIHNASSDSLLLTFISTDVPYDSGEKYVYEGKGEYYLDITAINVESWSVDVYEGISVI